MTRKRLLCLAAMLLLVAACGRPASPEPTPPRASPAKTLAGSPPVAQVTASGPHRPEATATASVGLPILPNDGTPVPPADLDVELTVTNPSEVVLTDEPVTSGIPLPLSVNLVDLARLRLLDENGRPTAAQFVPLARWGGAPDDAGRPVRWLLLDFQASIPGGGTATFRLVDDGGTAASYPPLSVSEDSNTISVDTGAAQFHINKADGSLSAPLLEAPIFGRAVDVGGRVYATAGPVETAVVLDGPMRASVHIKGAFCDSGGAVGLQYTARYWFYAGRADVRLFYTVENNNLCPLAEYGQLDCYEIGAGGGVQVADLSLVLPTDLDGSLTYEAAGQGSPVSGSLADELVLYQDSSGTDHWDTYPSLTDWEGDPLDTRPRMQAYVSFQGYRTTLGGTVVDNGDHAAGWLKVTGDAGAWAVGVRDFWQNFPKALRARPDGTIEIGLFPDEFGPPGYGFTLRAGEHKTHEIVLTPVSSSSLAGEGTWTTSLFASAPPSWYVDSGALGFTDLPNWDDWPDHEQYIAYLLDTSPYHEGWDDYFENLLHAIESTDFYGIFDYGDWPIDYEGYEVAPLNPKYDNDHGMWLQWARSGDLRWFRLAQAADRHLADVDILHNLHSPRHWGDGIAFGHSWHDEDGFLNPHRNGGGNHPDTAYGMGGLLLTYYFTGYEKAYEAAVELADCIEYRLHNDQHLCDSFPAGECSGEGYGLHDSNGLYDAGSRPAANGLWIAVAAYRATGDPRYLAVADAVVDWARADEQPFIGGPTGEDMAMRPWMLNMYLRALAEYLEMRDEFGLPDDYGARDSYLALADWLHSYAWLDLDPIETGPRAAYPYEWWFDGRAENGEPSINNWLLLGADAMAYAHHLSGNLDYLEWATRLFRTGSRDPWFEGDPNIYAESKEAANSISYGHVFLHEWGQD